MMRPIHRSDLPPLAIIEEAAQISPWSLEVFERCFSVGAMGWLIEKQHEIIAFVILLIQMGEGHILNLCVHPHEQHQGWGEQLLQQALQEAKRQQVGIIYLEVRLTNHRAIRLYKKWGFRLIDRRKDYYTTPEGHEDALILAQDLSDICK